MRIVVTASYFGARIWPEIILFKPEVRIASKYTKQVSSNLIFLILLSEYSKFVFGGGGIRLPFRGRSSTCLVGIENIDETRST